MKPSKFEISFSVDSYKKTADNWSKLLHCLKERSYKKYRSQILIAQIEDFNQNDCQNFISLSVIISVK